MKSKLNLDGLNEFEAQEARDKYEDWITSQVTDYMNAGLTDEITDEQAEALETLFDRGSFQVDENNKG